MWDPWNWAAVAASQELPREAGRDARHELCSCFPSWGTEGDTSACRGSPSDRLGPLTASLRPFLLPARREKGPGEWQLAWAGVSENWHGWVRASSEGEKPPPRPAVFVGLCPCQSLAPLWLTAERPSPLTTKPQPLWFKPNPAFPMPFGDVIHFIPTSKL